MDGTQVAWVQDHRVTLFGKAHACGCHVRRPWAMAGLTGDPRRGVLWIKVVADCGSGGVTVEAAADFIVEQMPPQRLVERLWGRVWLVHGKIPDADGGVIGKGRHINAAILFKEVR